MRKPMIPIFSLLFLLTLALAACGNSVSPTRPNQSTLSQLATQADVPIVVLTPTQEKSPAMITFPPIHGEQVTITSVTLEQSTPGQWSLRITGQKATPCHEIKWQTEVKGQAVKVEIGASPKPDAMCAQVITDFEQVIPIPALSAGGYQVFINGILVGEIQV
jgi:hypothetical protein